MRQKPKPFKELKDLKCFITNLSTKIEKHSNNADLTTCSCSVKRSEMTPISTSNICIILKKRLDNINMT